MTTRQQKAFKALEALGMGLLLAEVVRSETFSLQAIALQTLIEGRCNVCGYLLKKRPYGCDNETHVKFGERMSRHGC